MPTVNPDGSVAGEPPQMPVGTDEPYRLGMSDEPAEVLPFAKDTDPRVTEKNFSPRPVPSDLVTDDEDTEGESGPKASSAQESVTSSS